jgi:hypothetical protein
MNTEAERNLEAMTISDAWLLTKKIALGAVITVVPLAILTVGLWLTQRVAGGGKQTSTTKVEQHAN